MPVMVTGASTAAGRAAVAALLGVGGEVRVYADPADGGSVLDGWRAAACKIARGTLDDEGRVEQALEQVHTVAHLASRLTDSADRTLDELAVVVSAAIGAGCRRFIWMSQLQAADPGANPYLRACAEGETLLSAAPMETVVYRCALTYGPEDELTAALAHGAPAGLDGAARHAPLYVEDLAGAVVAADRMSRGGEAADLHLVLGLAGPQDVSLDEFCRLLPATGTGRNSPLPVHVADVLNRDQPRSDDMLGMHGVGPVEGIARMRRRL
ncbi:MAG TPA: NAD(P)H-binding protein [Egibacteraceae bacterium]|nr:NAD(P)H-binding protein [Egibacteraceae bacterium]